MYTLAVTLPTADSWYRKPTVLCREEYQESAVGRVPLLSEAESNWPSTSPHNKGIVHHNLQHQYSNEVHK